MLPVHRHPYLRHRQGSGHTVNAPANSYTASCDYANQAAIDAAYATWLGQFSVTGGCSATGSYGTAPAAPTFCVGDTVSVTYTVTDKCYPSTVTRTFGIANSGHHGQRPGKLLYRSCTPTAAIDAAYATWLGQFSVTGGCSATGSYGTAPAAPTFCVGDTVSVTYNVTGTCYAGGSVTRFFGIAKARPPRSTPRQTPIPLPATTPTRPPSTPLTPHGSASSA